MATRIYKLDDEGNIVAEMCNANMLQGLLAQGYVVDPTELEATTPEAPKFDIWKGMSSQDVRDMAKESGIDDYKTARIATLKAAFEAKD